LFGADDDGVVNHFADFEGLLVRHPVDFVVGVQVPLSRPLLVIPGQEPGAVGVSGANSE